MSKNPKLNLLAICLATWGWSFSFGLGTQVITHFLKGLGASNTFIGLNHSTYYLGIALASLAVPWLTRRLGHACAPLGMILSGLSLALFPWGGGPVGWFLLRFINGLAGAMSLVPLETLVSRESPTEQRTRNFSFYAVALTLGGAIGIWAGLSLYHPESILPFLLGGIIPGVAGLFLYRMLPRENLELSANPCTESLDWSRHFLNFGTAWFQGFLEGGMLAFLSLYLMSLGMTSDGAGGLMSVTMVGVILFQVPVAWLADRFGRLPILLVCYGMVAAGLILTPMWQVSIGLVLTLFLLGACSGALYPMALSLLGDRLPPKGLARAYALFLAMECVGSQMGAAIMGKVRDWWGEASMFGVGLAALVLILGTWTVLLVRQRKREKNVLPLKEERRAA